MKILKVKFKPRFWLKHWQKIDVIIKIDFQYNSIKSIKVNKIKWLNIKFKNILYLLAFYQLLKITWLMGSKSDMASSNVLVKSKGLSLNRSF